MEDAKYQGIVAEGLVDDKIGRSRYHKFARSCSPALTPDCWIIPEFFGRPEDAVAQPD